LLWWNTAPARPDASPGGLARWVILGAVLALFVELVVSPHIIARDNLRFWHSLGSSMYLVQWCCAVWVFGRLSRAWSTA
jgi:hypothetical protein